jgi:hypothetical protein
VRKRDCRAFFRSAGAKRGAAEVVFEPDSMVLTIEGASDAS